MIKENKVMLFSKSFCPYCDEVKDFFQQFSIDFKVIELDQVENGD